MLLLSTRDILKDMVDPDGNLYEMPVGSLEKRNLDKRRIEFLKKYVSLLLETKIISKTTKLYLFGTGSLRMIIQNYNRTLSEHEQINLNTAQSKVNYDKKKLESIFPDDMLSKVVFYRDTDIGQYEKQLALAFSKYATKNNLMENLALKLPSNLLNDILSDQEFDEIFSYIAPYCKSQMKYIQENLPAEEVGYINCLMSTQSLQGVDKERFERLQMILE
jgi:hypothetical protein